jgi:hypothetical protein
MSLAFSNTIAEFKTKFDRGQFTYSEELPDARDKDITDAYNEAVLTINGDLYPSDNSYTIGKTALLYLTAHFLCKNINGTDSEGQSDFMQSSRSVGSISEALVIPAWMQEGIFALFSTTSYGIQFLTISKPYLDGAVYTIEGGTNP